jgi:hypothetical protein
MRVSRLTIHSLLPCNRGGKAFMRGGDGGGGCMGICIEEAGDEVKSLWSLYVGLHTRCNVKHNQI